VERNTKTIQDGTMCPKKQRRRYAPLYKKVRNANMETHANSHIKNKIKYRVFTSSLSG
jgi:hypothetical protein